ncbi:hypothetical protein QUF54_05330 [Candidatus Marithioploca araucensis]|uniref:PIN domain-containing protein n=1 Tax=Candidatus Marithioploca araucensis TaxID=70273 RepID=A0ABT7VT69_9GAMM|nr:hypothetical protein [Candidatus Marithioploca araucensis]
MREQRERHHIDSLTLDEASTLQLHKLPQIHRDPFVRMLVCQAIEHNLIILTPDPMIKLSRKRNPVFSKNWIRG